VTKITWAQRDFSAGQADDTVMRRDDEAFMRKSLRVGRNLRVLSTGAATRRPGRRAISRGDFVVSERIRFTSQEEWRVLFSDGSVTLVPVESVSALTVVLTSLPWTAQTVSEIVWVSVDNRLFVVHPTFRPVVLTLDPVSGSWSSADFRFGVGPNGESLEAFYQFQPERAITLQPTARSGTVLLTASAAVFNSSYVGVRLRYGERQVQVSEFVSPSQVRATVIEQLPPTLSVTVVSTAGFQVGDVVTGQTSGCEGLVTAISGTILSVLVSKNWSGFEADENIISPGSKTKVTASAETTPAAWTFWDEAFCSAARGWPGSVSFDRQRLIFCRFRQLSRAILEGGIADPFNFAIGPEADQAFLELVPDNCTVLHLVGGPDQFVFTDLALYYIPISTGNPLKPGSVEFREISRDASSRIKPQPSTDGLVFINSARTRVMTMIGTGQAARPYIIDDLSERHSALFKRPVAMAVSSSDVSAPERYIYVVNEDGTMAVARYQQRREFVGWLPWDGVGRVLWIHAAGDGEVAMIVEYDAPDGPVRLLEVEDDTVLTDATVNPDAPAGLLVNGMSYWLMQEGWPRGEGVVAAGVFPSGLPIVPGRSKLVGFHFQTEVMPFVPQAPEGESRGQRMRRRRLARVATKFLRTQALEVGSMVIGFYRAGEDQGEEPPLREEVYRTRPLGRSFDPQFRIRTMVPGKFTLLEVTMEAT
jgi:hypothetical protein